MRVLKSIQSVLRAANKEFSPYDNYSKGHGELFRKCIETYNPGALILHVEISSGFCQYLAVKGAGVVYMNHLYWIEFSYERLQTPMDNILQENIFIILSSLEMMELACLCAIIHTIICLPTLWLAGNDHILDN